ncbi:vacuolar protein sorting-associated protein 52 [Skeletonema marinoi]|uniref:Vacuolar protein sorting-associated protein 52 n=2 Tax=Skeletonema marinoi TaxID=267567 RepID=A0AAD9DHI4_9STRA|nr:vacuolar protein sorting-associated protein 52 [Skeletonema marinoi]
MTSTTTRSTGNNIPKRTSLPLLKTAKESGEQAAETLSADLAVFLSDPSLRSALADGSLDLASYSSTINSELATLERECIALHRQAAPDIRILREEMDVCDSILAGLQEMLLGFQADLSGLSGDIRQLQDQSRSLAVQVDNRRDAEEGLRLFLERIVVPPNLAECICRGEVDELFLECVKDLEEKNAYVQLTEEAIDDPASSDPGFVLSSGIPPSQTAAGKEMIEHLSKLRLKAVERTRSYFLNVMKQLRRPKTHIRMIQTHALLKYEYLVDFLLVSSPTIHIEIRDVYVESMSKTLHTLFRTYHKQLLTLDMRLATRVDLIAVEEGALRDAFSTKSGGDENAAAASLPPINAHLASMNSEKYSYEMIFRSIISHLIDAATNEYIFARQFFKEYGQNDCWEAIFGKTLSLVLEQLENYLFNCHDAIAILLMIKLTHSFKRTVKARRIDKVMDPFLDRVANLFWPRLKMVMDAHLRSIRGANAKKVGGGDIHPHLVSRRYAEFTCSILLILNRGRKNVGESNAEGLATPSVNQNDNSSYRGSAGDMLMNDLDVMLEEMVLLLKRLADVHATNIKRNVFMINNLDQIITIFKERRVSGKELNRFSELLVQQRELFVEEELLQTFSKMIAFVQQTEAHMSRISAPRSARGVAAPADVVNPDVVESLVREFASNWKAGIEQINRNVLSYFSNFRNGMEILKQVLTQLLLYYTRFQDVIRKVWRGKPPSFCKDLVSTSVILAEIKKHALAI